MPRIYNQWGEPLDFCIDCFPDEEEAEALYSNDNGGTNPDDPDSGGYGYDSDHPDYEGEVWQDKEGVYGPAGGWQSNYTCEECHRVLRERDNNAKTKGRK